MAKWKRSTGRTGLAGSALWWLFQALQSPGYLDELRRWWSWMPGMSALAPFLPAILATCFLVLALWDDAGRWLLRLRTWSPFKRNKLQEAKILEQVHDGLKEIKRDLKTIETRQSAPKVAPKDAEPYRPRLADIYRHKPIDLEDFVGSDAPQPSANEEASLETKIVMLPRPANLPHQEPYCQDHPVDLMDKLRALTSVEGINIKEGLRGRWSAMEATVADVDDDHMFFVVSLDSDVHAHSVTAYFEHRLEAHVKHLRAGNRIRFIGTIWEPDKFHIYYHHCELVDAAGLIADPSHRIAARPPAADPGPPDKVSLLIQDSQTLCMDLHRFADEWAVEQLSVDPFDETKSRADNDKETARIDRHFSWRFKQELDPRIRDVRIRFEVHGLQGGYFYGMGSLAPTSTDKIRDIAQALHDWEVRLREKA